MYVSFTISKPQPEHSQDELAGVTRIPAGVTSKTQLHLWDLRKIQVTRVEEVLEDLLLEVEE